MALRFGPKQAIDAFLPPGGDPLATSSLDGALRIERAGITRPERPGVEEMVTPNQKALVQETFAAVVPIADDAAQLFYRRLFELDPSLQAMFRGDMAEQRRKLMNMLGAAVRGLDHLEKLVPVVQDLGRKHAGYGVEDRHYDTVGAALLWTLDKGLGAAFTPEVAEAWAAVYGLLASTMQTAARDAAVTV
jgi:hemoglobin-like flavoprotein